MPLFVFINKKFRFPPLGLGAKKKFGFSLEYNNYNPPFGETSNTTILSTGGETNVKLKKENL